MLANFGRSPTVSAEDTMQLSCMCPMTEVTENLLLDELWQDLPRSGLRYREGTVLHTLTSHSPINIDGNANFSTTATNEGWPGDGSNSSPYVIANYSIEAGGVSGIRIANVDVYFIIENVHVNGSTNFQVGAFQLTRTQNGHIINSNSSDGYYGIHLVESNNNSLTGNLVTSNDRDGIHLHDSSNNNLTGNSATSNDRDGFHMFGSSNNILSGNTATQNREDGFHLHASSNYNILSGNTLTSNHYGINLGSSIKNNSLSGNILALNFENNALDNTDGSNTWDSNSYGDFTGGTPYTIPGTAGAVDQNPIEDSDGDGYSDYDELVAGTDPRDPASSPRITSTTPPPSSTTPPPSSTTPPHTSSSELPSSEGEGVFLPFQQIFALLTLCLISLRRRPKNTKKL